MRPRGQVFISKIVDGDGKSVALDRAIKYRWVNGKLTEEGIDVGQNLFVDNGRQLMAYTFGYRSPISDYVCAKFGVGTGTVAAKVTDVALQSPVTLNSGQTLANIDSIDFLTAFVVRVAFTLGLSDANGYALTEFGLFSGNNTLLARKVRSVAINKTSDFSPTITWRLRF